MENDLDKYYTPMDLAERVLQGAVINSPKVCVDSTCGEGNLLKAASSIFSGIHCVGIDRDKKSIINLRKQHPDWLLSAADLMAEKSLRHTSVIAENYDTDLLFLNPPFSHGNKKSVEISFKGDSLKASVAMAHILQSFKLFEPSQGAVIFAPESILYSDTDALARAAITKTHRIEKIAELVNTTFRGARVNTLVIRVTPGKQEIIRHECPQFLKKVIKVGLVRGGLPVHEFKNLTSERGMEYIHTTSLKKLISGKSYNGLGLTDSLKVGKVSKWLLLVPRVGLIDKESTKAIYLVDQVQLSDCVIAVVCNNKTDAKTVEKRISDNWDDFKGLYRGTAARYITLSRLNSWLLSQNIIVHDIK